MEEGSFLLGYMGFVYDLMLKLGCFGFNICVVLIGVGMGIYGMRRMFFFWGKLWGGVWVRLFLCFFCGDWNF